MLIVEDHRLFAEAITPFLHEAGMEVLERVPDGAAALATLRRERPDVVLVDLSLPDMDGIELGRIVLRRHPTVRVLALTGRKDPRTVREALRAGFHGYMSKDTPLPMFAPAIQAAIQGQMVKPDSQAAGAPSGQKGYVDLLRQQLTPRDYDVLALLVEGASTEDMAARLSLSPNTVRSYVQNVLGKLQVRSRLEAAALAVRYRLLTPPQNLHYG